MIRRVLVTGGSGFVGKQLLRRLAAEGRLVTAALRVSAAMRSTELPSGVAVTIIPGVNAETDWTAALSGVDSVVHCAAQVPSRHFTPEAEASRFYSVNVEGSAALARQAAAAGVRRLVFVSSIKVNGETTPADLPFRPEAVPSPEDAYGRSKLEAERALQAVAASTGLEVVVLRPPALYGPMSAGNVGALLRAVALGFPLPFGAVRNNRRSLLAVENLVDALCVCLDHPSAAGKTFLASDGEDVSTAELLQRIGHAVGRPALLVPVPVGVLRAGAVVLGQRDSARRLLDSLRVDCSALRQSLDWKPPLTLDAGLRRAALEVTRSL